MKINKYQCFDNAIIVTYIDSTLVTIEINTSDQVLFDGVKYNIAMFEDELKSLLFSKLKVEPIDKKIAMFCNYYKRFSKATTGTAIVYNISKKEIQTLKNTVVNDLLLDAYFTSKEWWCKQKNVANYCHNINQVKLAAANNGKTVSEHPNKWDAKYFKSLPPEKIMSYRRHLTKLGYKPVKDGQNRTVKWKK